MTRNSTLYLHLSSFGSQAILIQDFLRTIPQNKLFYPLAQYDCTYCVPSHIHIGMHLRALKNAQDDSTRGHWSGLIGKFWQGLLNHGQPNILFSSRNNIEDWHSFWQQATTYANFKNIDVQPIFTLDHQEDALEFFYHDIFNRLTEDVYTPNRERYDYAFSINSMLENASNFGVRILDPEIIWRDHALQDADTQVLRDFGRIIGLEDISGPFLPVLRSYEALRFTALVLPPHSHEAGARLNLKPKLFENAYLQPMARTILSSLSEAEKQGLFTLQPLSPASLRKKAAQLGKNGNAELGQKYGLTVIIDQGARYPSQIEGVSFEPLSASSIEKCVAALDKDQARWLIYSLKSRFSALTDEQREVKSVLEKRLTPEIISSEPEYLASVLTLSFNMKDLIARNIESVIAQKCQYPVQHIIVDDGSDDGSQQIILDYASKYPHIKPVIMPRYHRTHDGKNILNLFGECNTKYAALCDGDDYFTDPLKLQKQIDFLEKYPDCAICFHPVDVIYEDGSPSRVYPPEDMLPGGVRKIYTIKDLFYGNLMQTNSVMYRWRFKGGVPEWFDPTVVPGDWYWHLLHAETGFIGYLPERMSVYWRHKSSLYATADIDHVEHRKNHGMDELRTYNVINKHFKNKFYTELSRLANGVLSDFLRIYLSTGDDTILKNGIETYPKFGHDFMKTLEIKNSKSM